jgi:hypothetical protein
MFAKCEKIFFLYFIDVRQVWKNIFLYLSDVRQVWKKIGYLI